ncbi:MAG: Holliday junction resolvase RuvX [Planctomycetes bacterium]|nr:Holliday junction resolvase RuvX [Planctomycetota bacterium]
MSEVGRIMAIDYGDKRTGLALCEESGRIVVPYDVITEEDQAKLISKLASVIQSEGIEHVVIGLPLTMSGETGGRAIKTETFGKALSAALGSEVKLAYEDERLTSYAAEKALAATGMKLRKMKGKVDAVAACEILRTYLKRIAPHLEDRAEIGAEDMPWEKPSFDRRRARKSR